MSVSSEDPRKPILDHLSDLLAYWGKYHDHKEAMGWSAVALFVLAIPQATRIVQPMLHTLLTQITGAGSVLLLSTVTVLYIRNQFALMRAAAAYIHAVIYCRTEVVATPADLFDPSQYRPKAEEPRPPDDPQRKSKLFARSYTSQPKPVIDQYDDMTARGSNWSLRSERTATAIVMIVGLTISMAHGFSYVPTDSSPSAERSNPTTHDLTDSAGVSH